MTNLDLLLPDLPRESWQTAAREPFPVLYLLHGYQGDHTSWQRNTALERYAMQYRLAIVMPRAYHSYYVNLRDGYAYEIFVGEELPAELRRMLNISDRREDTYIAGNSMGGYGAFRFALNHPERYGAAISFSGALDRMSVLRDPERLRARQPHFELAFGDGSGIEGGKDDLFHMAGELADSAGPKPKLLQLCGTEDSLYDDNIRFRDRALSLGLPLEYRQGSGKHEWSYWDRTLPEALQWLDSIRNREG